VVPQLFQRAVGDRPQGVAGDCNSLAGVILRNAQAGATCGSPAETHAIEKSMSDTKMADQGRVKPALAVHSAKPFIERI